jgi:hypothetical protein
MRIYRIPFLSFAKNGFDIGCSTSLSVSQQGSNLLTRATDEYAYTEDLARIMCVDHETGIN